MSSAVTKRKMSESRKNNKKVKKVMQSEEYKEKLRKANSGKHKYNNGIIEVMRRECPEGFVPGVLKRENKGNTGMDWYNNGTKNIQCFECPEGFVPGVLK